LTTVNDVAIAGSLSTANAKPAMPGDDSGAAVSANHAKLQMVPA